MARKSVAERFEEKVDRSGGPDACHIWNATRDDNGYGRMFIDGRRVRAHRIAYELANGPIPQDGSYHGGCVCHNCPGGDNPSCVNPAHLFLGTAADNNSDRKAKQRSAYGTSNGRYTHPERTARGDRSGAAKLTERDIPVILDLLSECSQADVSRAYEVDQKTIWKIAHAKTWKHVPRHQGMSNA